MKDTDTPTTEELMEALAASIDSLNTHRVYGRHLDLFYEWCGEEKGKETPYYGHNVIMRYLNHLKEQGKSASVRNQALAAIKKLCYILQAEGIIDLYDYVLISNIKVEKYRPLLVGKYIPESDIKMILAACRKDETPAGLRDGSIIALLHATGMRRGECATLEMGDLNLSERKINLTRTKNKRARTTYINDGALHYLRCWLRVRGDSPGSLYWRTKKGGGLRHNTIIHPQTVYNVLKKRCKEAGLKIYAPHDLRRTLISNLLNDNIDLPLIARLVGHSNPDVTARYDARPDEEMRRAAYKIYTPYESI